MRHLAVGDLWVQQRAKDGEVVYNKLEGKLNTSDILTKPVDRETLMRHMQSLGLHFRQGRNPCTPAYNGKEDGSPGEGEIGF